MNLFGNFVPFYLPTVQWRPKPGIRRISVLFLDSFQRQWVLYVWIYAVLLFRQVRFSDTVSKIRALVSATSCFTFVCMIFSLGPATAGILQTSTLWFISPQYSFLKFFECRYTRLQVISPIILITMYRLTAVYHMLGWRHDIPGKWQALDCANFNLFYTEILEYVGRRRWHDLAVTKKSLQ